MPVGWSIGFFLVVCFVLEVLCKVFGCRLLHSLTKKGFFVVVFLANFRFPDADIGPRLDRLLAIRIEIKNLYFFDALDSSTYVNVHACM